MFEKPENDVCSGFDSSVDNPFYHAPPLPQRIASNAGDKNIPLLVRIKTLLLTFHN